MDKELLKYFEDQFELFSQPGFKEFVDKAKEIREVAADLRRLKTADEFQFAKGQLDILDWVVNWEHLVRTAYEQNKEDE